MRSTPFIVLFTMTRHAHNNRTTTTNRLHTGTTSCSTPCFPAFARVDDVGGLNIEECGWDGGDCCFESCVAGGNCFYYGIYQTFTESDPFWEQCLDPTYGEE